MPKLIHTHEAIRLDFSFISCINLKSKWLSYPTSPLKGEARLQANAPPYLPINFKKSYSTKANYIQLYPFVNISVADSLVANFPVICYLPDSIGIITVRF